MKKKRIIIIILLFIFLTSMEMGIFLEALWHGWGGFGDISKEYTEDGSTGIFFLMFFIPVSVLVIFLIRITFCIKKIRNMKALFLDCICALLGIGITVGISFIYPIIFPYKDNPIFWLGSRITAFLIEYFNWMDYPIP